MDASRRNGQQSTANSSANPPYQGANGREIGQQIIRCLHTDRSRPPHADDAFEFHWRCTATFQTSADEMPYCPFHLPTYTHSGRVTREDVSRAEHAMKQYERHATETIPHGRAVTPAGDDLLTDEDLERLRQHRQDQLARAREAGLPV